MNSQVRDFIRPPQVRMERKVIILHTKKNERREKTKEFYGGGHDLQAEPNKQICIHRAQFHPSKKSV